MSNNIHPQAQQNYQLKEVNARRLLMLNQTLGKKLIEFLQTQTYLTNTKNILDLGCGNGFITQWLAEQFSNSIIMGIDNRSEQIDALNKQYATTKQNTHLQFKVCAAENLHSLERKFDFVLCSLLLKHVEQPLIILKEIYQCLNKNGKILVFDNAWSNYSCNNYCDEFYEIMHYFKLFYNVQQKPHGNDYGLYASGDLLRSQFNKVKGYIEEIVFTKQHKKFFKLHFLAMQPLLLAHNMITANKVKQILSVLDSIINDDQAIIKGTIVNSIGEKI